MSIENNSSPQHTLFNSQRGWCRNFLRCQVLLAGSGRKLPKCRYFARPCGGFFLGNGPVSRPDLVEVCVAIVVAIEKAINAHCLLKAQLQSTISSGSTEMPIGSISADYECELGKWLYGETLTRHDRSSIDYKVVKKLHAHFHEVAGRVAEYGHGTGKRRSDVCRTTSALLKYYGISKH